MLTLAVPGPLVLPYCSCQMVAALCKVQIQNRAVQATHAGQHAQVACLLLRRCDAPHTPTWLTRWYQMAGRYSSSPAWGDRCSVSGEQWDVVSFHLCPFKSLCTLRCSTEVGSSGAVCSIPIATGAADGGAYTRQTGFACPQTDARMQQLRWQQQNAVADPHAPGPTSATMHFESSGSWNSACSGSVHIHMRKAAVIQNAGGKRE